MHFYSFTDTFIQIFICNLYKSFEIIGEAFEKFIIRILYFLILLHRKSQNQKPVCDNDNNSAVMQVFTLFYNSLHFFTSQDVIL